MAACAPIGSLPATVPAKVIRVRDDAAATNNGPSQTGAGMETLQTPAFLSLQWMARGVSPTARESPRSETFAPGVRCLILRRCASLTRVTAALEKGGQGSWLSPAANYQRVGHLIHMSLVCPDSALAVNAGGPAIQRKNTARALALPELSAHIGRQDCGCSLAVCEWSSSDHGLMSVDLSRWLSSVSDTSFPERPHRLRPVCPTLRWSH